MNSYINKVRQRFSRKKSLRWSMVRRLLFGWFFPLFILILIIVFFVAAHSHQQVEHTILTSLEKAVQIMNMQLKYCETASKNASYMPVISESYAEYLKEGKAGSFRKNIIRFLEQQYQFNDSCRTAELILLDDPSEKYYVMNASKSRGTYRDIEFFYETACDKILETAQTLDTGTALVAVGGRTYMVRNLVNSRFSPYAVLALELNMELLMESYAGIWGYEYAAAYWNGELMMPNQEGAGDNLSGRENAENILPEHAGKQDDAENILPEHGGEQDDAENILPEYVGKQDDAENILPEYIAEQLEQQETLYVRGGRWDPIYVYRRIDMYGGSMVVEICIDKGVTHAGMSTLEYLFIILIVFMIPLVIQMMRFFYIKVTRPMKQLITAANAVREGNLGIQIENNEDNEEFCQMKDSFNHMSRQLKNQFDRIYLEEVALRDARIMALQSQINPHFLNNTLEIINWEARLNGNYKVSGMIEALSTMLGETMNRNAQQFHSVAEEMAYADAYLYIISQRFGSKFQCEKHIDERLMNVQIPRLIIQPIVENAVEHGMDITRQGRLEIRLYERGDGYLSIEVEDNGHLTQEDRDKIDRLLSPDAELSKEKRVSLGIRNVDQRLKMIYGTDCGLFITGNEKEHTVSKILLKIDASTKQ